MHEIDTADASRQPFYAKATRETAHDLREGGRVTGNPFLWIPFARTNLKRAIRAAGGAFSALSSWGLPLLFDKHTKEPVGIESVDIRKRLPKRYASAVRKAFKAKKRFVFVLD